MLDSALLPRVQQSVNYQANRSLCSPSVWVVIPTYNEVANLPRLAEALLRAVPGAQVLVVDDNSPDGTGRLAENIAKVEARVAVLHRARKAGLGPAYVDGMSEALGNGAERVVQMDCDLSHDPLSLPELLHACDTGADLVLGSRYVGGGACLDWPLSRRVISSGGNLVARVVLGVPYRDLTGGFKVWRASLLEEIDLGTVAASGYGFQIEMTWRAHQLGAKIVESPITFRDRTMGDSKMSAAIAGEALRILMRLRARPYRACQERSSAAAAG